MSAGLFLALLLAAQPPAPDDALALYRAANGWEISAVRRSCSDASLQPRLAAARQRMATTRGRLTARFGAEALRRNEVPMVVMGDPCANPTAAADSLANLDAAVARLETALAQAPATSPAQTNPAVAGQPPLDENRFVRLFLYRLHYFHRTAAQQDCMGAHPERTRALDARYDALERRAVALLGPVRRGSGTDRRRDGYDDDCRRGIILNGYELALHDLELRLAEVER